MKPMKTAPAIILSDAERRTLLGWSRGRRTPARLVLRAKIVLASAEGTMSKDIASQLGTSKKTVSSWRGRFAENRVAGMETDATRPGRKRSIPPATIEAILRKTTQE
jgi:transposase